MYCHQLPTTDASYTSTPVTYLIAVETQTDREILAGIVEIGDVFQYLRIPSTFRSRVNNTRYCLRCEEEIASQNVLRGKRVCSGLSSQAWLSWMKCPTVEARSNLDLRLFRFLVAF
eukprot:613782-Pyramimonas_sp.AAC.3